MNKIVLLVGVMFINVSVLGQTKVPNATSGVNHLKEFLHKMIRYPTLAAENGVTGTVVVAFVVNPDSTIDNIQVSKRLLAICDSQVVTSLNKYKRKLPLNSGQYTFGVSFRMYNSKGMLVEAGFEKVNPFNYRNYLFEVNQFTYLPSLKTIWTVDRSDILPGFTDLKGKIRSVEVCYNTPPTALDEIDNKLDLEILRRYNTNGKLILEENYKYTWSILKTAYKYDDSGRLKEILIYDKNGVLKSKIAKIQKPEVAVPARQSSFKYDKNNNKIEEYIYEAGILHYKMFWKYSAANLCIEERMLSSEDELIYKDTYKYDQSGRLTEKVIDQTNGGQGKKLTYTYKFIDKKGNWLNLLIKSGYLVTDINRKIDYFK